MQEILKTVINLRADSVTSEQKKQAIPLLEQAIYDVKTALSEAERRVLDILGVDAGLEARKQHEEKCRAKGYMGRKEVKAA